MPLLKSEILSFTLSPNSKELSPQFVRLQEISIFKNNQKIKTIFDRILYENGNRNWKYLQEYKL